VARANRDPIALADAVVAGDRAALPRLLSVVEAGVLTAGRSPNG
jgi:hypothetical protein